MLKILQYLKRGGVKMDMLGVNWSDHYSVPIKIEKEVSKMLKIHEDDLQSDLLEVFHHQSKIISIKYTLAIVINEAERQLVIEKKKAHKYLSNHPKEFTATQIKNAVASDTNVLNSQTNLKILKAKLEYFTDVFDQLKSKSTNIRTILNWNEYISGNR